MTDLIAGRFRVGQVIGSGGQGRVVAAYDERLQRPVALKFVHVDTVDEHARSRFLREARSAGVVSHPNVVTVFDIGATDGDPTDDMAGTLYIAMELVDGPSLARLLAERGPLPVNEARGLASQMLLGLAAAHDSGIVHRDVKPANVLVSRNGTAKLTDFGLATSASGGMTVTRAGHVIGTADYLAPERASGAPATPAADLYAVGVVLYEMLAGERPFTGDSPFAVAAAHQNAPVPPLRERRPDVPPALAAAVERALAKRPEERFASAEELRAALAPRRGAGAGPAPGVAGAARPDEREQASTGMARPGMAGAGMAGGAGLGVAAAGIAAVGAASAGVMGSGAGAAAGTAVGADAPGWAGTEATTPTPGAQQPRTRREARALAGQSANTPTPGTTTSAPAGGTPAPGSPGTTGAVAVHGPASPVPQGGPPPPTAQFPAGPAGWSTGPPGPGMTGPGATYGHPATDQLPAAHEALPTAMLAPGRTRHGAAVSKVGLARGRTQQWLCQAGLGPEGVDGDERKRWLAVVGVLTAGVAVVAVVGLSVLGSLGGDESGAEAAPIVTVTVTGSPTELPSEAVAAEAPSPSPVPTAPPSEPDSIGALTDRLAAGPPEVYGERGDNLLNRLQEVQRASPEDQPRLAFRTLERISNWVGQDELDLQIANEAVAVLTPLVDPEDLDRLTGENGGRGGQNNDQDDD